MAIPFSLTITGSVTAVPYPGTPAPGQSLQSFMNLGMQSNPTQRSEGVRSLIAAVDVDLDFGSVTKATFLALKVLSGALSMKITTPLGTDQIVPAGDQYLLSTPNPGQEMTAVKLSGTGDFQFILAGN